MPGTISTSSGTLTNPNIVIFISDETRFPQHWPADWVAKHLPTWQKLMNNGLTFTNAITAACECSPSRASFVTSTYPEENGVTVTFNDPLPTTMVNLADVLSAASYPVIWKGKWHLSLPVDKSGWGPRDVDALEQNYRMKDWNPPDAGTSLGVGPTLGGGLWDNDDRFVTGIAHNGQKAWGRGALEFLETQSSSPFCLVVSLVNPHDIFLYPDSSGGTSNVTTGGYDLSVLNDIGIAPPDNMTDDLSTKPSVQAQFQAAYQSSYPLTTAEQFSNYVNFYAYLHTLSDALFGRIYDKLSTLGLLENTIIIRMADHGEMGLSHGLREKMYTAYEEAIHVPLVYSNPTLWPSAQVSDAMVSSLDLLPTLAAIVGSTKTSTLRGTSYLDILEGKKTDVQDNVIYTFDDQFPGPPASASGHLRCVRTKTMKYAVYYNDPAGNFEYEMYDLASDPGECTNLLHGLVSPTVLAEWKTLHHCLTNRLDALGAMPQGVNWPTDPWTTES